MRKPILFAATCRDRMTPSLRQDGAPGQGEDMEDEDLKLDFEDSLEGTNIHRILAEIARQLAAIERQQSSMNKHVRQLLLTVLGGMSRPNPVNAPPIPTAKERMENNSILETFVNKLTGGLSLPDSLGGRAPLSSMQIMEVRDLVLSQLTARGIKDLCAVFEHADRQLQTVFLYSLGNWKRLSFVGDRGDDAAIVISRLWERTPGTVNTNQSHAQQALTVRFRIFPPLAGREDIQEFARERGWLRSIESASDDLPKV